MRNVINEIRSLMYRMGDIESKRVINEDDKNFFDVQKMGNKSLKDTNNTEDTPKGRFSLFSKLSSFLDELINNNIRILLNGFSYDDLKNIGDDEKTIYKGILDSLNKNNRDKLLGRVFEGILMKKEDNKSVADLSNGIELKTSNKNGETTLFQYNVNPMDLMKRLDSFFRAKPLSGCYTEIKFDKRLFGKNRLLQNKQKSIFNENQDYIFVGQSISENGEELCAFYLEPTYDETNIIITLYAQTNIKEDKENDIKEDINVYKIFDIKVPFSSIELTVERKLKNVFHVKGHTGTTEEGNAYAQFTDYECLLLKDAVIENLPRLICEDGTISTSIRWKIQSDELKNFNAEKKKNIKNQEKLENDFNKQKGDKVVDDNVTDDESQEVIDPDSLATQSSFDFEGGDKDDMLNEDITMNYGKYNKSIHTEATHLNMDYRGMVFKISFRDLLRIYDSNKRKFK